MRPDSLVKKSLALYSSKTEIKTCIIFHLACLMITIMKLATSWLVGRFSQPDSPSWLSFTELRTSWLWTILTLPNHLSCSQSGWQHGSTLLGTYGHYTGLRRAKPWLWSIDVDRYIITGSWELVIWMVQNLAVTWQGFTGLCWHLQRFSRAPVGTMPAGKAHWSIQKKWH